jgi:hypothetical protein
MNCNQVRSQFGKRGITGVLPLEVTQHLAECAACRTMVNGEDELRKDLRQLRDSAPEVPAPLDHVVMAAYRRVIDEGKAQASQRWRPARLVWAGAAAALILAVLVLAVIRKSSIQRARHEVPAASPPVTNSDQALQSVPKPVSTASAKKSHRPRHVNVAPRTNLPDTENSAVAANAPPVTGFQGLMFCDPLSCSGAMDVIRIQVPGSFTNRVPAARSSNGLVQADVVVGSDGVARAIRIVR